MYKNLTKIQLEDLILNQALSYEEIGRRYGCSGAYIKKLALKLEINLPKRRKISDKETFNRGQREGRYCINCGKLLNNRQSKYCSSDCQSEYQYKQYIDQWKLGKESGLKGEYGISNYIRRYLMDKYSCKCQLCGWGKVNTYTEKIPLEIHHIDGNYRNNKEENLQLLCPNCHSLTETYKSHNKSGRKERAKYTE